MPSNSLVMLSLPADPVDQDEASRKDFVERLGVPKFASVAARDAWFTSTSLTPLSEGQLAYLEDADQVQVCIDPVTPTWESVGSGAVGIPVFADLDERDATIPTPTSGMYCHLLDTKILQVYKDTYWADLVGLNANYGVVVGGTASGMGSVAVGGVASANNAIAVGVDSDATNTEAVAVGYLSQATAARSVAIGTGAVAAGADQIVLGSGSHAVYFSDAAAPPEGTIAARPGGLRTTQAGEVWVKKSGVDTATGWSKLTDQVYVDEIVTVSDVDPVAGTDIPSRDGLIWMVVSSTTAMAAAAPQTAAVTEPVARTPAKRTAKPPVKPPVKDAPTTPLGNLLDKVETLKPKRRRRKADS